LPICSVGICTWLLLQPKPGTISDIAASIFGLFYLGFLPSYWIKLRGLDSVIIVSNQSFISLENLSNTTGLHLTLTSCFLIVASDIGSYFIGKSFGKTSLSPISPSKTVEGLIGGIFCSILLAIFFAFSLNWENPLLVGILYGILISLMALVGDLIESMMKRDAKIKDSANVTQMVNNIACSDLFIAGSTGPLHIAGALNKKTVGFYPSKKSSTSLRWQTINNFHKRLSITDTNRDKKNIN